MPTRSLTPHHSTKQYNKRHVAVEAQVKTLEEAQWTQLKQSLARKSPIHTREHPTVTKLFWMDQGKLGRGTQQQHKKATPQSSPRQNEQTTSGMEFLHIYDTRGTYQYSAGILVLMQKIRFFLLNLERTRPAASTRPPCLIYLSTSMDGSRQYLSIAPNNAAEIQL